MNLHQITLSFTLLLLFLSSTNSQVPCFTHPPFKIHQRPQSAKSVNKTQIIINQNSSNPSYIDQYYLDGCSAIMQGLYKIYDDSNPQSDIYATWQNQNHYYYPEPVIISLSYKISIILVPGLF